MKIKNVKVGMTLVYKGGDQLENTFVAGDKVVITRVSKDNHYAEVVSADNSGVESSFNAKYLSKPKVVVQQTPNTVAGYMPVGGNINKRSALSARIVILPVTSEYTRHANVLANKFANESISAKELLHEWKSFAASGGDIHMSEFVAKTKLILNYILENEK